MSRARTSRSVDKRMTRQYPLPHESHGLIDDATGGFRGNSLLRCFTVELSTGIFKYAGDKRAAGRVEFVIMSGELFLKS